MEDYFENALFGTPFTAAVIVAAGSSQRMGGEDKQFIELCGKPVLARSMAAFQRCPIIEEIVVVTKPSSVEAVRKMAEKYGIDKLKAVVEGGENRAASVRNGVAAVSAAAEFVAIHDGARPLVTPKDITRCADDAFRCGGAVLAVPVTDTVKYGRKNGFVEYTPAREKLFAAQTPQIFDLEIYRSAMSRKAIRWIRAFMRRTSRIKANTISLRFRSTTTHGSFPTGRTTAGFLRTTAAGYF